MIIWEFTIHTMSLEPVTSPLLSKYFQNIKCLHNDDNSTNSCF